MPNPPSPTHQPSSLAAQRGEPSYVWRAGQERRLKMIIAAAGERVHGRILVDGCGVGSYLGALAKYTSQATGLEIEFSRTREARQKAPRVVCAACENLPFESSVFDLILSHEVLEHVQDDRAAVEEMARTLAPGGRLVVFVPNLGYPFETHGVYWRGAYHFGNIPLINYLPRRWRNLLAPHVRVYSTGDLRRLFAGLPLQVVSRSIIFGAYDNIIARSPKFGRFLRALLQFLEKTPLRWFGLSQFWVLEKIDPAAPTS